MKKFALSVVAAFVIAAASTGFAVAQQSGTAHSNTAAAASAGNVWW